MNLANLDYVEFGQRIVNFYEDESEYWYIDEDGNEYDSDFDGGY